MSDTYNAPDAGGEGDSTPITTITPANDEIYTSVSQAARALERERSERATKQADPAPKEAAVDEQQNELADEANAAPEKGPGETQEADTAEQPPIEPPRSWTKEAKEQWQSLPRETQTYLAQREEERDRDVSRRQTEAAEKLKGLTAKEQQVEQTRLEYERALPALLQQLQTQQQGAFSDIKTMADVNALAAQDPFRFAQWQAQQMQIAAVAEESRKASDRQAHEYEGQWNKFAAEQDAKLQEFIPEVADPEKAKKIADGGLALLKDIGFNEEDISKLWLGKASISLRDHRIQRLLIDGVKYREARSVAAKPTPKPVPQVQRPGVSRPKGADDDAQIQALTQTLERSGSLKDAQALRAAQRARRA